MDTLSNCATQLTNAVEATFGQEASADIARGKHLILQTINLGWRLLTHDSTEKGLRSPYRWMSLRRVQWTEVLAAVPLAATHGARAGAFSQDPSNTITLANQFVWHCVVHDLEQAESGCSVVVTAYFLTNVHLVFDMNREKFDLLVEDDPDIIGAAMSDSFYVKLLECYFLSGDQRDNRRFLTISSLTRVLQGKPLLHHCCENGFHRCVELLLDRYTRQTAELDKPWLWLADPILKEPNWGNSAFSIAVYRSDLVLLQLLWDWAKRCNLVEAVLRLVDRKGLTLLQLAEQRVSKLDRHTVDNNGDARLPAAVNVYNFLAQAFGVPSMQQDLALLWRRPLSPQDSQHQGCFRIDSEDQSLTGSQLGAFGGQLGPEVKEPLYVTTLKSPLCLADLTKIMERAPIVAGCSVLIRGIEIASTGCHERDCAECDRILQALSTCSRVSVLKCSTPPGVCIAWATGMSQTIRRGVRWRSVRVPSFVPAGEDTAAQESAEGFADAIKEVLTAARDTWALGSSHLVDISSGTSDGTGGFRCIPLSRRNLIGLMHETFRMKKVLLNMMKGNSHWSARDQGETRSTNPFFHAVANVERRLLQKYQLTSGEEVCLEQALDPTWALQVEQTIATWVWQVDLLPRWCLNASNSDLAQDSCLRVRDFVDRAIIQFLRLRPGGQRPGLYIVPVIARALTGANIPALLPRTARYSSRWNIDLGMHLPSPLFNADEDSATDEDTSAVSRIAGHIHLSEQDAIASKGKGKSKDKGKGRGKNSAAGENISVLSRTGAAGHIHHSEQDAIASKDMGKSKEKDRGKSKGKGKWRAKGTGRGGNWQY